MTAAQLNSHAYAEQFVPEGEALEAARHTGSSLGAPPIGTGGGAALRLLAAAVGAHHVVEVGEGAGVSGLWLLDGMPEDGVLTTIELEPEHALRAKRSFSAAGIAAQRTRVITGRALDVLPRMNDSSYDLVHIDAGHLHAPAIVPLALERLEPGGVLVLDQALLGGAVADPTVRTPRVRALRQLLQDLARRTDLTRLLLPIDDGMLVLRRL